MNKFWQWLSQVFTKAADYCAARSGVKSTGRLCWSCKKPIRRNDHWRTVNGKVKHWNCNYPQKVTAAYVDNLAGTLMQDEVSE